MNSIVLTLLFLPKSQGAVRNLTWARLQTNLKQLKFFLEISDEALIPKIEISLKQWIMTHLGPINGKTLMILVSFEFLFSAKLTRCSARYHMSSVANKSESVERIFRSQKRLIYPKSKYLEICVQYHNVHWMYDGNLEIIKHTYIWTFSYTDIVIFLMKRWIFNIQDVGMRVIISYNVNCNHLTSLLYYQIIIYNISNFIDNVA
jgi:hypothetical protein